MARWSKPLTSSALDCPRRTRSCLGASRAAWRAPVIEDDWLAFGYARLTGQLNPTNKLTVMYVSHGAAE
jgi:hypothetical protein